MALAFQACLCHLANGVRHAQALASDNSESITFALVQNGKDIRGEVVEGQGVGDVFEGELCGSEFRWIDATPGELDPEQGCWTLTQDGFTAALSQAR